MKETANMQNNEVTPHVLAIDSNHDEITQIVHDYREQYVYPYLESSGFSLVRCQGPSAFRENVASEACQEGITYITGSAHGSDTTCFEYDWCTIFEVGDYQPEEVEGKVVHLLSCQTAAELGRDFVKNGCLAYFGYKGPFAFDPYFPDIFLECDAEIDKAFADGLTAAEVHDRVVAFYEQRISELNVAGEIETASTLKENLYNLCTPAMYGYRQVCILDSST